MDSTRGYDPSAVGLQSGNYNESTRAKSGEEEKQDDYNIACIICLGVMLLLISGLLLYVVFASSGADDSDEPDDFPRISGGGGGGTSGGDSGPDDEDGETTVPGIFPGGSTAPGTVTSGPTVTGRVTGGPTVPGGRTAQSPTPRTTGTTATKATTTKATTTKAPTTKAMTTKATATTAATRPTTKGTTVSTTTRELSRDQPLLCTVGKYAYDKQMYPPDGLCDVIFYTHVYLLDDSPASGRPDFVPSVFSPAFTVFKAMARASGGKRTQYGMSLDDRYIEATEESLLGNSLSSAIDWLWHANVRHFGVLNVDADYTGLPKAGDPIKFLFKRLKELTEQRANYDGQQNVSYIVLATKVETYNMFQAESSYGHHLSKWSNYSITMLVANSAINTWREGKPCEVSPPNAWSSSTGLPAFDNHITILKNIEIRDDIAVLFSFTMAVAAHSTAPGSSGKLGDSCKFRTMMPYSVTCDENLKEKFQNAAFLSQPFCYGVVVEDVFYIWDTGATIEEKMKNITEMYPRQRLGVMVFDVEFEDIAACHGAKYGTFPRLRVIRELMYSYANKVG